MFLSVVLQVYNNHYNHRIQHLLTLVIMMIISYIYGQCMRQRKDVASDMLLAWFRRRILKWETEPFIIAAQNQTNYIKTRLDTAQENSLCRISGLRADVQRRDEWVGTAIHWELCKQLEFNHIDKWYERKPKSMLENEDCQFLWGFEVQADRHIETWRPDLIIVNKGRNTCQIADFATPGDQRFERKERGRRRNLKISQDNLNSYGIRK